MAEEGVKRAFSRQVRVPGVSAGDWELVDAVFRLIASHAVTEPRFGAPVINATDSRGNYEANAIDALRAEQHERGEPIIRIYMLTHGREPAGGWRAIRFWVGPDYGAYAEIESGDEIFAAGLASRIEALATAGAKRAAAGGTGEEPPRVVERAVPPEPPVETASERSAASPAVHAGKWAAFRSAMNHPWVVTVGGGIVVALVAYLIFGT
jgi:hypothetical protein